MKCPKCHYLSFDPEPRCRNCGFTLTLDPDLAIHPPEGSDVPLADLALRDLDPAPASGGRAARRTTPPPGPSSRRVRTTTPGPFDDVGPESASDSVDVETTREEGQANPLPSEYRSDAAEAPVAPSGTPRPTSERRLRRPVPPATAELPLFVKGLDAASATPARQDESGPLAPPIGPRGLDEELLAPPASTASRRTSVGRGQMVDPDRIGPLDHDLLEGLQRIEHAEQRQAAVQARLDRAHLGVTAAQRAGAASVDALFLGVIAAGILSVTMRWAGLEWGQVYVLPIVPLLVFVLLVAVGYLFVFTAASGQTVGKMLMGIRVVDAGQSGTEDGRVSVSQALYRGALTIPSVLLFGVGFVPALTRDGRAAHDRITHTRVVRA